MKPSPTRTATTYRNRSHYGIMLMKNITRSVVNFMKREDGPTAVEYAVMLALIIVVCIAAVTTLGTNANANFSFVAGKIAPVSS